MQLQIQRLAGSGFNRHLIARNYQKRKFKRMIVAGLMLTSMVDMFSLLVIFLLQTFSSSPELAVVAKGVTLPAARSSRELKDAPVLALSNEGVYLDQKFVGVTQELLENPAPLMSRLEELRTLWMKTHPGQSFPGEISLQADQSLSSATVSRFMGMLPGQSFGSIQLAVIAGGSTGGS